MNLAGVDLNLLVVLDALLRERNVTRAGQSIGLSQPATSNALRRLRDLCQDPLLVRGPSGMVPTERALALEEPVRQILVQIENALAVEPPFSPETATNCFRLAMTDFAGVVMLPPMLQILKSRAPGISLQILPLDSWETLDALEEGKVDGAIGFFNERAERMHVQALFEEEFVCVVRQGHPEVVDELSLETYCRLGHILVSPRGGARGIVDDRLEKMGLQRHVAVQVPHFAVAPVLVSETDYILTIARRLARRFESIAGLSLIRPPIELPRFHVRQVWHERTHHSAGHAWLRALMAQIGSSV
jgi:DNA-binding transcriptional LysR family regulator